MSDRRENTDCARVAFQGEPGAYSHQACRDMQPAKEPLACATFEDAFEAVEEGRAELAIIPIENSTAGRVADIHMLLPHKGLYIIAEYFLPISHALLAPAAASEETLKQAYSHVQALHQCRDRLRAMGLEACHYMDTAGAARHAAERNDPAIGAIASPLAAEIYGLKVLRENFMDHDHNTTRFVALSARANDATDLARLEGPLMTSFLFEVKNVPAALYKAMGGFATNGVNMTKLESYQRGGGFAATAFYAEIEGSEKDGNVAQAMEELHFQTKEVRMLGSYLRARSRNA